jgi:hypothetical protein
MQPAATSISGGPAVPPDSRAFATLAESGASVREAGAVIVI